MSVKIIHGDCRTVIPDSIPAGSLDSVVTDPPYHLTSSRASAGFMGKQWDGGDVAFQPETWRIIYDAMKPGAHLAAFGGTRTFHRMACAIEDAGFEIRDTICWLYGVGFPKSHSINKTLCGKICSCDSKPTPECDLRSLPDADVPSTLDTSDELGEILFPGLQEQGSLSDRSQCSQGESGRSKSGLEGRGNLQEIEGELSGSKISSMPFGFTNHEDDKRVHYGASVGDVSLGGSSAGKDRSSPSYGSQSEEQRAPQLRTLAEQSESQDGGAWPVCGRCGKPRIPDGIGTALKPAYEPIIIARKPLDGTVAANTLKHGVGGINVDACRVEAPGGLTSGGSCKGNSALPMNWDAGIEEARTRSEEHALGRWPANVVHDGSDEVMEAFPDAPGQQGRARNDGSDQNNNVYGKLKYNRTTNPEPRSDEGSAARFFYQAKATKADRAGSKHPTVKPISLMRWVCRLITPPGGTILDPFAGSGTTGQAAKDEGFSAILIERESEYINDINRRLSEDAWWRSL